MFKPFLNIASYCKPQYQNHIIPRMDPLAVRRFSANNKNNKKQ